MFKHIWSKFKTLVGVEKEVPPTPASEQEKVMVEIKPEPKPVVTPKPIPKTIGAMIEEEKKREVAPPPTICPPPTGAPVAVVPPPVKKPRRPRQKKVAPSPEVLAVYQDPKPVETEKLDTRLDGHPTKPKKTRVKKPAAKKE